jgi:uncharacterized protein (TIGR00251 family)
LAGGYLSDTPGGTIIEIWAKPRSSKTKIAGLHGPSLSVAISAPPVEGEANKELTGFFAKLLGVPKTSVELASGSTGRNKRLLVKSLSPSEISKIIDPLL